MWSGPRSLSNVQRLRKYSIASGCLVIAAMLFVTRPAYDSTYYGFWLQAAGILRYWRALESDCGVRCILAERKIKT